MHLQKLGHTQVHHEIHILRQLRHQLAFHRKTEFVIHGSAIDQNLPSGGRIFLGDALNIPQEPAFTGAGGTDYADNLPFADRKLHILRLPAFIPAAEYGHGADLLQKRRIGQDRIHKLLQLAQHLVWSTTEFGKPLYVGINKRLRQRKVAGQRFQIQIQEEIPGDRIQLLQLSNGAGVDQLCVGHGVLPKSIFFSIPI
ncbi:hypothetical protein D3C75_804030 [compost metagenome]